MFSDVKVVFNMYSLPSFLIVELRSFPFLDIGKYQVAKNSNVTKVLPFACPCLFKNYLLIRLTSYRQFVLEVIGCLHYFSPKVVGETAINQYQVLCCDNSSSSLLDKIVFLYTYGTVYFIAIPQVLQKDQSLIEINPPPPSTYSNFVEQPDLASTLGSQV